MILPKERCYANIVAEMAANGTPFADAAAEIAFRTWFETAWVSSGCPHEFLVLKQPASSLNIQIDMQVFEAGALVEIWWGGGQTETVAPAEGAWSNPYNIYSTGQDRSVVVLGGIKKFNSGYGAGFSSFGGRVCTLGNIDYLRLVNDVTVTGPIPYSPELKYVEVTGMLTYATAPGAYSWSPDIDTIAIASAAALVWSSEMTDALIIDVSGVTWAGAKSLSIVGYCGAPTAAADDAIDSLIAQGATVNTN